MNTSERRHERVEQIFSRACDIDSEELRSEFVLKECGNDEVLRSEIEDLLRVEQNPDSFLNEAALGKFAETNSVDVFADRLVGQSVGNYKLLQKLGEGGMGTVFLAEQTQPIQRRVALKIVKAGMDSKQFAARFEAERQALAMMDHPNIARVYDAGCIDEGRPYFVMELVKGIPITKFCDENKLSTRERLELFLPVCNAVQHAHQKGIIHRDLKPSNVLVALYDDRPVPKVIDFGVAKATNQRLTEKTLFTMIGQIVGTWEYMSPEQAVLNQLDVDTRSDVYSLGVILYQLLTGVTPIDGQRLRTAGLEEVLRLIREEEPQKPSTRVSSLNQATTATSGYQRTDSGTLASSLRGDLDWIVMKTLDKDRVRRYQTSSELAADLERHLAEQPVHARAPSAIYRVRKHIRRNRGLVTSLSAIFLAMAMGLIISLSALKVAKIDRIEAEKQKQIADDKSAKTQRALSLVKDYTIMMVSSGNQLDVQRAIELSQMVDDRDSKIWPLMLRAQGALYRGDGETCVRYLDEGLRADPNNISCKAFLTWISILNGDWKTAGKHLYELRDAKPKTAEEFAFMAQAHIVEPEQCIGYANEALKLRESVLARLARAEAIVFRALDANDDTLLPEAIREIEIANEKVRSNPYVWVIRLFAEIANIQFATKSNAPTEAMHAKCRSLIAQLEQLPDFNIGRAMTAFYFNEYGTAQQRDAAWRRVLRGDSKGNLWHATVQFLTPELAGDAIQELHFDDYHSQTCRRIFRLNEPDGGQRLMEWHAVADRETQVDFFLGGVEGWSVLIAGNQKMTREYARSKLLAVKNGTVSVQRPIDKLTLRVMSGEATPQEFLAAAGDSLAFQEHCNLVLGFLALSQRSGREDARRYFQDTVGRGIFHSGNYIWAKAMLRHMAADHTWPHWIDFDKPGVEIGDRLQVVK